MSCSFIYVLFTLFFIGVVNHSSSSHNFGSDGEGGNVSSDEVLTPSVMMRNHAHKLASKRLSLPGNVQLPSYILQTSPKGDLPLSRRMRRASLVSLMWCCFGIELCI